MTHTSRRTVLKSLAAAVPAAATTSALASTATLPTLQPTALGHALMQELPGFTKANLACAAIVDIEGAPGYDRAKIDAAQKAFDAASQKFTAAGNAILAAAEKAPEAHLADVAIYLHAMEAEGAHWDHEQRWAAMTLASTILRLAGVPEADCRQDSQPDSLD